MPLPVLARLRMLFPGTLRPLRTDVVIHAGGMALELIGDVAQDLHNILLIGLRQRHVGLPIPVDDAVGLGMGRLAPRENDPMVRIVVASLEMNQTGLKLRQPLPDIDNAIVLIDHDRPGQDLGGNPVPELALHRTPRHPGMVAVVGIHRHLVEQAGSVLPQRLLRIEPKMNRLPAHEIKDQLLLGSELILLAVVANLEHSNISSRYNVSR